ncbi:MAG: 30S ribosomal protein S6 [Rhabdochlamydiaceae bacterium]|nr:30S ribosomal protein S6 [Rhabdochlamydiaceae bacterium]
MSKQGEHLYEGMYILSATLSDDARQKALEKITSGITTRGGEICKMFDQGRRKLAYEINNKREGYYYILYFSISTKVMNDLWREYHLNEDLLRFLTLRTESVPEKLEFKSIVQE